MEVPALDTALTPVPVGALQVAAEHAQQPADQAVVVDVLTTVREAALLYVVSPVHMPALRDVLLDARVVADMTVLAHA